MGVRLEYIILKITKISHHFLFQVKQSTVIHFIYIVDNVSHFSSFLIPGQTINIQSSDSTAPNNQDTTAERAYDKDITSKYIPQFSSEGVETWIKFNLGKLHVITKIVVINRLDRCPQCQTQLDSAKVTVVRTATEKTTKCGVIKVAEEVTEVTEAAQTYSLDCGGVVGDQVIYSH